MRRRWRAPARCRRRRPRCWPGRRRLEQVAALPEVDAVMAAIVGAAGLPPTLAAVRAGKRVLLANKEALVMAGAVFMAEVAASGADAAADRQRAQCHLPVAAARFRRRLWQRRGVQPASC